MRTIIIALIALACLHTAFVKNEPANKAALGKLLFFDPILSKDSTISCASCHKPAFAFADTGTVSTGVGGKKGTRNTPSSMNVRLQRSFFWDGRAANLEEQALAPIENPDEMNLPLDEAIARLQKSAVYSTWFQNIFQQSPNRQNLAAAIAAFERTLETSDSPFDEWKFSDNPRAVSDAVKRGFEVFNGKGKCVKCHFGADFTQSDFRNIGLFDGKKHNDSGRMAISKKPEDLGRFKVGSLRNVSVTAPYMHNGLFRTLKEVIEFYDDTEKQIPGNLNRDTILQKPLGLTKQEKSDLEAFLRSLTDKSF